MNLRSKNVSLYLLRTLVLVGLLVCLGAYRHDGNTEKRRPAPGDYAHPAADAQPSPASWPDLQGGDFALRRSPPLIPSAKLRRLIDHDVCISGVVIFYNGRAAVVEPPARLFDPLAVVLCQAIEFHKNDNPQKFTGIARGILRLRPVYASDGVLETVFFLEGASFERLPTAR
jgi:hypothetical protein